MRQVVVALGRRFGSPVLGIDLRGGTVRAAVVRRAGKGWEIARWAEAAELEQEAGAQQPDLGAQLKSVLAKLGRYPRRAAVVVGFQHMLLRSFRFPKMPPARMRQLVERDGDKYIPFYSEGANFDLKPLRELEGKQTDLLVTAVKSSLVAQILQACQKVKLQLVAVDIDMVALFRAVRASEQDKAPAGITALLDVDQEMVRMGLYLDGAMLRGRAFPKTAESTAELAIDVRRSLEVLLSQHAKEEAESLRLTSLYTSGTLADGSLAAELTRLLQADMAQRLAPEFTVHQSSQPAGQAPPETLGAFGAALATAGPPAPADLLPRLTWEQRQQRTNKAALTVGCLAALTAYGWYWKTTVQDATDRFARAEQTIQVNQSTLKRKAEIERLEARQKDLEPVLKDLRVVQKPVNELIPAVQALTPAGIRLSDLSVQVPLLVITGTTEKPELIVDLIARLSGEPYVANVSLGGVSETEGQTYQFRLSVTLRGAEGVKG